MPLEKQQSLLKNFQLEKEEEIRRRYSGLANRQIFDIEYQDAVFLSFASDGHDNTEAAGAIGDGLTVERAKELNLNIEEFLENHNSFEFLKKP